MVPETAGSGINNFQLNFILFFPVSRDVENNYKSESTSNPHFVKKFANLAMAFSARVHATAERGKEFLSIFRKDAKVRTVLFLTNFAADCEPGHDHAKYYSYQ
jgi:hypothetical protein